MTTFLLTLIIPFVTIVALSVLVGSRTEIEGVDMQPKRTKNLRIWAQYAAWNIQAWMSSHQPYLPLKVRGWLLKRFPQERWNVSRRQYEFWQDHIANFSGNPKPLPWPIRENAVGPFVGPWERLRRVFNRHTGGRSHRCEFTDPQQGALYGHNEGAFMDDLFEQFLGNIGDDEQ